MKKVFVSLPMGGRSKEDILRTQEQCRKIAEIMLNDSAVLIQSYFENQDNILRHSDVEISVNMPVWELGLTIGFLSYADVVVFAPGSRKARGCKVERLIANLYKIPTIDLSTYGLTLPKDDPVVDESFYI